MELPVALTAGTVDIRDSRRAQARCGEVAFTRAQSLDWSEVGPASIIIPASGGAVSDCHT